MTQCGTILHQMIDVLEQFIDLLFVPRVATLIIRNGEKSVRKDARQRQQLSAKSLCGHCGVSLLEWGGAQRAREITCQLNAISNLKPARSAND
ncbi:hypothetical protein D3C87_1814700 [compost metagenome]